MRLTLHWRGKPLVAVDLAAASPEPADEEQGPPLQASAVLQDMTRSEPMEPDTRTFGIGLRPESHHTEETTA